MRNLRLQISYFLVPNLLILDDLISDDLISIKGFYKPVNNKLLVNFLVKVLLKLLRRYSFAISRSIFGALSQNVLIFGEKPIANNRREQGM